MSVLSLAAAVLLTGVGTQEPAKASEAVVATIAPSVQIEAQQRVSVSFSKASVTEVLDWLSKNGANFIAADSEIPKDVTVTMSVKDQPIEDVVDALAGAMGGHWVRRNGIRVFRKGGGLEMYMPTERGLAEARGFGNFKVPEVQGWSEADTAKFRSELKAFPKMRAEEMKALKEKMRVDMPKMDMDQFRVMPEIRVEGMKELEEAARARSKAFGDNKVWIEQSREAQKASRKELEKMRKEHPDLFNGRVYVSPNGSDFRVFGDKGLYGTRTFKNGEPARFRPFFVGGDRDMTKILGSLSPDQRETQRRQGYLRARDLRPDQRRMLGIDDKAKGWTIKIVKDGEELTVKSDD